MCGRVMWSGAREGGVFAWCKCAVEGLQMKGCKYEETNVNLRMLTQLI